MHSLPLIIEIIELVEEAGEQHRPVHVEAEAARLLKAHPEAETSKDQIADLIRQERAGAPAVGCRTASR
jgi:hypothetical protein